MAAEGQGEPFCGLQIRHAGSSVVLQSDFRRLPVRIALHLAIVMATGLVGPLLWNKLAPESGVVGGIAQVGALVCFLICGVAIISLSQLLVFSRFPLTIDLDGKRLLRGKRVLLEGKFKADIQAIKSKRPIFHVRLSKKDEHVFVCRVADEARAKRFVAEINSLLSKGRASLSDTEVGEDPVDHVG